MAGVLACGGSRALIAISISISIASIAAPASAQPMDTYGMGSRSIAMGGAVTADVSDFSANYYNPAGLVRGEHIRVSVGWMGVHHELAIDGLDSNVDPVHGLVAGLVVPGNLGGFRFAFGLGVHLNDDRVSRTRALPRQRPRWEFYDNRPHRTYLATHLAVRPWDWLMIGGGISFLSYARNTLSIRGDIDALPPHTDSRLEHTIEADLSTIRYPQIGIQVMPIPELSFGLVYRGEFALSNVLHAEVGQPGAATDTRILFGDIRIPGYFDLVSESVNAFVPHQVSLGASWTPIRDLTIELEVTWLNWSAYVSPIGRAAIVLEIEVPPALAEMVRVPTIPVSSPIAAHFEDRFVPRIGVEGIALRSPALEVAVRGGGFYERSPIPPQGGVANLVDTDRIALSAGAGLRLTQLRPLIDGWLAFDLHAQWGILPERLTRKASPIDTVGDWRASGHLFSGGLTMELGFR